MVIFSPQFGQRLWDNPDMIYIKPLFTPQVAQVLMSYICDCVSYIIVCGHLPFLCSLWASAISFFVALRHLLAMIWFGVPCSISS